MQYLISYKDRNTEEFTQYLSSEDEHFCAYLNPAFAKQFLSEEEARNFIALNWVPFENKTVELCVVELDCAIHDYHELTRTGMKTDFFRPFKDHKRSRPYDGEDSSDILKWWMEYHKNIFNRSIAYEDLRTWPKLYSVFEHIFGVVNVDGELTIEMRVNSDSNFQTFKKELELALPYITLKDEGDKVIHVVDYRLCVGGRHPNFYIRSIDGECYFEDHPSIRAEIADICGNLKTVFEYWRQHYPFTKEEIYG